MPRCSWQVTGFFAPIGMLSSGRGEAVKVVGASAATVARSAAPKASTGYCRSGAASGLVGAGDAVAQARSSGQGRRLHHAAALS